eukprot:GFUD01002418.1.p1 GENE.GFUD01002418.1~~GFUD01002418.1.p1  ORF type:complete len:398 (+),score=126.88 GFUD01002418.1:62-1255(+)
MSIFKALNQFHLKTVLVDSVVIHNTHMNLYKLTAMLVYLCSIMASTTTMFGDPIHCMVPQPIPEKLFTSYCYMEATFTMLNSSAALSVAPAGPADNNSVHHSYYQWVWLMLSLQSLLTFLPYWTWQYLEGGKLAKLLQNSNPVLIGRFLSSQQGWYASQATYHLFCQLSCLIVSMAQVYLMDRFMGGQVVLSITSWPPPVFPLVTKCTMAYIGPSGSVVSYSGLCTLNYNLLHEKIYMMVIPCYLLLTLLSTIHCSLHLLILLIPNLRLQLLKVKAANLLSNNLLAMKVGFCSYGDFVLFMLLSANLGSEQFSEMMQVLVDNLGNQLTVGQADTRPGENRRRKKREEDGCVVEERAGVSGRKDKLERGNIVSQSRVILPCGVCGEKHSSDKWRTLTL